MKIANEIKERLVNIRIELTENYPSKMDFATDTYIYNKLNFKHDLPIRACIVLSVLEELNEKNI